MTIRNHMTSMARMFIGTPDVASCRHVQRSVQNYLDGGVSNKDARRIRRHLEICKRCGLEASTYRAIKESLAKRAEPDDEALSRLRNFGRSLGSNQGE